MSTSTPAPVTAPAASEACPTSGRTAAWCTDRSHLTCGTPARKPRRVRACKACTDGVDRLGNICTVCAGDGEPR